MRKKKSNISNVQRHNHKSCHSDHYFISNIYQNFARARRPRKETAPAGAGGGSLLKDADEIVGRRTQFLSAATAVTATVVPTGYGCYGGRWRRRRVPRAHDRDDAAATCPGLVEVTAAVPPAGTVFIDISPAVFALRGRGAGLMGLWHGTHVGARGRQKWPPLTQGS